MLLFYEHTHPFTTGTKEIIIFSKKLLTICQRSAIIINVDPVKREN